MINKSLPAGTNRIYNQGAVHGPSTDILTDDPATSAANDPTVTPVVLPTAINLLYFRAIPSGNLQVELSWSTAAEVNNYGFMIKRAEVNDFAQATEVGFVPSAVPGGNGSGTTYQFRDTAPKLGQWVYWLVDVDNQGQQTPHAQTVTVNVLQESGFSIYIPVTRK
jgi:hypothetical protein